MTPPYFPSQAHLSAQEREAIRYLSEGGDPDKLPMTFFKDLASGRIPLTVGMFHHFRQSLSRYPHLAPYLIAAMTRGGAKVEDRFPERTAADEPPGPDLGMKDLSC